MRIRELISQRKTNEIKSVRPEAALLDAAGLLTENNIGALPVVGGDKDLAGIVSERDIVRALVNDHAGFFVQTVGDIMTRSVITCSSYDDADEVYDTIHAKNIRHIPVVDDGRLSAMLSIRDFENAHRRMREQSLTDELTGLHNLRHFLTILDNEFNRYRRFQSPLAMATVQIDKFQDYCAERGVADGDALLKTLAGILVEQTRTYDAIGRTADDQFAIVFPNTDAKTANRACERLIRSVRSAAAREGGDAERLSISIGLAFANHRNSEGMSIMKRAGELAHSAAASGGDCIESDSVGTDGNEPGGDKLPDPNSLGSGDGFGLPQAGTIRT